MIAVIAGTGNLPVHACKSLLASKKDFYVICLFPNDNAEKIKSVLNNQVPIIEEKFYKLGKILALLKELQTKELLFIGKVDKRNLFKNFKFDFLAIKLLTSTLYKSDKQIMETLLSVLKKENIEVLNQQEVLKNLLVSPGILTGKIDKDLEENISYGMQVAENISFADIGQTIAIKDKMILAVEAIEGTDECILRGIALGQKDIIICKTAHKNQNKKYDLPTLGPSTLKNINPGEIKVIAWKSDQTFISDQEEFILIAQKLGITLISV